MDLYYMLIFTGVPVYIYLQFAWLIINHVAHLSQSKKIVGMDYLIWKHELIWEIEREVITFSICMFDSFSIGIVEKTWFNYVIWTDLWC